VAPERRAFFSVPVLPEHFYFTKESNMKRVISAVFAATMALGATAAFAQASGAMANGAMSHDAMSKDAMSKDAMSHDAMSKGSKSDKMKKHDAMGMDHPASGAMAK
jgi:pentapeptide MXKDX repeat protein